MPLDADDVPTSILVYGVNEDGHWCPDKNIILLSYNSANAHSMSPCRKMFENLRVINVIDKDSVQDGQGMTEAIGTLVVCIEHE